MLHYTSISRIRDAQPNAHGFSSKYSPRLASVGGCTFEHGAVRCEHRALGGRAANLGWLREGPGRSSSGSMGIAREGTLKEPSNQRERHQVVWWPSREVARWGSCRCILPGTKSFGSFIWRIEKFSSFWAPADCQK